MYYFAIFAVLLSAFINSSAQLQYGKTSAGLERTTGLCDSHRTDRNADKQQHKSYDYSELLSDEVLRELLLKRALFAASRPEHPKISNKQQDHDSDALAKVKGSVQETRTGLDVEKLAGSANDQRESSKSSATEKVTRSSQELPTDKITVEAVNQPVKILSLQHLLEEKLNSHTNVNSSDDRGNTAKSIVNGVEKDKGEPGDIDKISKEVSRSESLHPAPRPFEQPDSRENLNYNRNVNVNKMSRVKGEPTFRLFQNDASLSDDKYNPPPYVENRMNAFNNRNSNVNVNTNINEMSVENEGKMKDRNEEQVRDRVNDGGAVGTDPDDTEKKPASKTIEAATTSESRDSVQLKNVQEVNILSTTESLDVVASSTTPSVKFADAGSENDGTRHKKRRKHRRGKGRGRGKGKTYKKKNQREQRQKTEQLKNTDLQDISIGSLPNRSGTNTVENVQVSTESSSQLSQSPKTADAFVKDKMSKKNSILTRLILKLLIVNTGRMSTVKSQRLERLLDLLNTNEKELILRDLEQETNDNPMKVKLDENTPVRQVIISEAKPQLIVGLLARPRQPSPLLVDKNIQVNNLSNKPENQEDTKQNVDVVNEKEADEKLFKKSPESADKISTKVAADHTGDKKENVKNNKVVDEKTSTEGSTSDRVVSDYNEPLDELRKEVSHKDDNVNSNMNLNTNVNQNRRSDQNRRHTDVTEPDRLYNPPRGILHQSPPRISELDVTLDGLRDQAAHQDGNINSNTNDNQNRLSAPSRRRIDSSRSGGSYGRPRPRIPESDLTEGIEASLIPSSKNKDFKSRARNHGRYSGISNNMNTNQNSNINSNKIGSILQDRDEPIEEPAEPHRLVHKTDRNPERKRKRPSNLMDFDSAHRDKHRDETRNVKQNRIIDATESDIENTRRSANRRLPNQSNQNRNINRNVNINTIQTPSIEDYYIGDGVSSSRRTLGRTISGDGTSNSNSNVNSNVNINRNVDRFTHRNGPRHNTRTDEVTISQETVDSILREVNQLRKQLAEKEAATNGGNNLDHKRTVHSLHEPFNERVNLE